MTVITAQTLIEAIEAFAPLALKEANDPTGFQIGRRDKVIHNVMTTLDVRPEVVQEAIDRDVDFLFAHHPVMFRPAHNLDLTDPQNKLYADLISHDITVYAAHTNLDKTLGGMNDWLAAALQLTEVQPFNVTSYQSLDKLVVFVPVSHAEIMRSALAKAGAGQLGDYTGSSFTQVGTGRFTPNAEAQPFIGAANQAEAVEEARIEVVLPRARRQQIVAAMLAVHPYEEPAYDLIELANEQLPIGLGRIGCLAQPLTVTEFAQVVGRTFNVTGLRLISQTPTKLVRRVAIVGGDGGKFYPAALAAHADVYVTGDVYYHTGHDMLAHGLSVIDPGHHIESIVKPKMVALFNKWAQTNDWSLNCFESTLKTDPFTFIFTGK